MYVYYISFENMMKSQWCTKSKFLSQNPLPIPDKVKESPLLIFEPTKKSEKSAGGSLENAI